MTLQQTISQIIEKPVTETEAKEFALNNFGLLATFIRENKPTNYLKEEEKEQVLNLMVTKNTSYLDALIAEAYHYSTKSQQRNLEDAFPEVFQHYLKLLKSEENVPDNQPK